MTRPWDPDNLAVAILFAGSTNKKEAIGNPIVDLFNHRNLSLITGEAPPPPPEPDIVSVQLTVTGPAGPVLKNMERGSGKEWNTTVTLTTVGTHTLKFVATSKNGNTGSETITITVKENDLPQFVKVKVITPQDGATVKKGELPIKVEATYEGQY